MNDVLSFLSIAIPIVATICNIFLFSTLLTAKKKQGVIPLMFLLAAFIMWTSGSAFMRLGEYPGTEFWWKFSLTGLFFVPFLYYIVVCSFTGKRGFLPKVIYGIVFAVFVILSFFDVFVSVPTVTTNGNLTVLHYQANLLSIIPIVFSVWVLIHSWIILISEMKSNDISPRYIQPFVIGVYIMVIGVVMDIIPFFNPLPMDTLACAVNAVCIYTAFCKRRLYPIHQITSKGAMFAVSTAITTLLATPIYKLLNLIVYGEKTPEESTINTVVMIICSMSAILIFIGLNKLNEKVFIKDKSKKEDGLKQFSKKINATLNQTEILDSLSNLLSDEIALDRIYICMIDGNTGNYTSVKGLDSLEAPISIGGNTPIVECLRDCHRGIVYSDFVRSRYFRSMWESEKQLMTGINASFILPFFDKNEVMGFAVISQIKEDRRYSFDEIIFLDSVSAVASIALKNAHLYSSLEHDAQCDMLTDLYNRKTFTKKLSETIANGSMSPISVIIFNIDDLSLFNELYGNEEGDVLLKSFSSILSSTFGSKGILCRYSGKEFAVLLPCTDSATAYDFAYRVKDRLTQHIDDTNDKVKKFSSFSAGICTYPTVAANETQLLSYANLAVFNVKQNGKNNILIYSNELNLSNQGIDKKETIHELTSTIFALTAAVDAKDHYTFNHSNAVSAYATKLAQSAGLPDDMVEIIRQAGLLHDIGKIGIPDAILTKNGKLTDEEYAIIKTHSERSIEMIRHLPNLDYVIPAVYGHHERYDGRGYPRGISGSDIPIGARCLAIADSFDAMVSKRAYRDKMPLDKALGEITKNLGTQFDPELGKLFVEKVSNGEIEIINY